MLTARGASLRVPFARELVPGLAQFISLASFSSSSGNAEQVSRERSSPTPMATPIAIPAQYGATACHCARRIASDRGYAPCRSSGAPCTACRTARHGRPAHQYMALGTRADGFADQPHGRIPRPQGVIFRTRLICTARAVGLASCNASETHTRPLSAPNWSVAIPNSRRRALENLAGRYHDRSKKTLIAVR